MAERVDAPGDVVHKEDPHESAPEQAARGAGDLPLSAHPAKAGIARLSSTNSGNRRLMAGCRGPRRGPWRTGAAAPAPESRTASPCARAKARETLRRLRRRDRRGGCAGRPPRRRGRGACGGRNPAHHRALHRHRAEDREAVFERLRHRKGAVGEHPVEADGHPEGGDHVHHRQDHQVLHGHRAVPQQHDRDEKGGEREHDRDNVDALLKLGHI